MNDRLGPFLTLAAWHAEAAQHPGIRYAGAACLATIDGLAGGGVRPDARIVLVHAFDATGFVFGTDERSAKARQLAQCPEATLVFHWEPLERQVRVCGTVETHDEESDFTFEDRPRDSRVTAWASQQSGPIQDRAALDASWRSASVQFDDANPVPRPPTWRAYRLVPSTVELWQAGAKRLHDRLRYERGDDGRWLRSRLQP